MFKIGEFSKLTQVSIRMLRHYDETGLLKPAQIDPATGYRFYCAEQIPVLQRILLLRDMDFHVAEIAEALREWEEGSITALLEQKKAALLAAIRRDEERVAKIEMAKKDIALRTLPVHCNVILKSAPSQKLLSLRRTIPDYFCEGQLWEELGVFLAQEQPELAPGVNNIVLFHNGDCVEDGVDVEIGVLVKKLGKSRDGFVYRELAGEASLACVMVYGPYTNIGAAFHAFASWLEEHRPYRMDGPIREICHIGPPGETNPERFLTEIQIPVIK